MSISFMENNVEFFHILLAINTLKNGLFDSVVNLLAGLFAPLVFIVLSSLYILHINPQYFQYMSNVSSNFVGCLLTLVIVSFDLQTLCKPNSACDAITFVYVCSYFHVQKRIAYLHNCQYFPIVNSGLRVWLMC
jgi:hypothetical protein